MNRFLLCFIWLWSACAVDVTDDSDPESGRVAATTRALFADPTRTIHIVAHQDDDITVMNPNLLHTIARGNSVRVVYLTAGDAGFGCQGYWAGRESGVKLAYEKMAGLTPGTGTWTSSSLVLGGKTMRLLNLTGKAVSLVFMGLPNPPSNPGLLELWHGSVSQLTTVPDTRLATMAYTRAELIETLRLLLVNFNAQHINTLDSSRIWGTELPFDHHDHVASALFALAAAQRYTTAHTTRQYRTYNISYEIENVSDADTEAKHTVFAAYYPRDLKICSTIVGDVCPEPGMTNMQTCDDPILVYGDGYQAQQYPIAFIHGVSGGVRAPGSANCLKTNATSAGSALVLASCDPASGLQQWQLRKDGTLRHLSSGRCANSAVTPGSRGAAITLQDCVAGSAAQTFGLSTVGQLRGPDATCVQAAGTSLSIQECSNASGQLGWGPHFPSPVFTAIGSGVGDTEIPAGPAAYATLNMADVDGNGRADVCFRRGGSGGGVFCALFNATTSSYSAPSLKLSRFRDSDGFSDPAYGSTVQLADINGDGNADVCGRGTDGVYCATWDGASAQFSGYAKRTSGWDFSDTYGYNWTPTVYRALRLVDVTGDGKADICSRNSSGVECATNSGSGSFNGVTQWISSEFSDSLGWDTASAGITLRFADIDGDGKRDVCGRGMNGIHCALNDGTNHFAGQHQWADTDDFSDWEGWDSSESYYGSIRLVDIDGDGKADICGRGIDGIVCGTSLGASFSQAAPPLSLNPYSDGAGWSPAKYGATLMFGDLTGDGRPELCARGPIPGGGIGLRCATGLGVAP